MIIRDEITKEYIGIKCDAEDCKVLAPPSKEILAGHGLNNMGWRCIDGSHYCHDHAAKAPA